MKEILDELVNTCGKIDSFDLSPSAYAELKEDLHVDLLKEIHRYKNITLRINSEQIEDVLRPCEGSS